MASGLRQRLLGLALRGAPRHALYIPRCRSVHTVGMRFRLDLVFLDADGRPLKVVRDVGPWRVVGCRGAAGVLELPSPPRRPGGAGGSRAPAALGPH